MFIIIAYFIIQPQGESSYMCSRTCKSKQVPSSEAEKKLDLSECGISYTEMKLEIDSQRKKLDFIVKVVDSH